MKSRDVDTNVDFEDYLEAEVFDERARMVGHLACYWTDDDDEVAFLGIDLVHEHNKTTVVPVRLAEPNERRSCVILSLPEQKIKTAPALDCDEELDNATEERVFNHFELEMPERRQHRLHIHRSN